jgi:hypothetical protein
MLKSKHYGGKASERGNSPCFSRSEVKDDNLLTQSVV